MNPVQVLEALINECCNRYVSEEEKKLLLIRYSQELSRAVIKIVHEVTEGEKEEAVSVL